MRKLLLSVGIAIAVAMPVAPAFAIEPDAPDRLITAEEGVGIRARQMIEGRSGPAKEAEKSDLEALVSFYADRDSKPLWISDNHLSLAAKSVIGEIKNADDWGLKASAFDLSATSVADGADASDLAAAEVALSVAVLKYANHARGGRIPDPSKLLTTYLDRKPQIKDPSVVLSEIAQSEDKAAYLRGLNPQHPQFLALRKALLKLRNPQETEDGEKVVRIPDSGPLLKFGSKHEDVVLLRKRLKMADPIASAEAGNELADPEIFDKDVVEAVKAFQKEAGLYTDGVVGNNTRAAFNGAVKAEITEGMLIANMEEWRWMPDDLGEFYINPNIPEYKVRVFNGGENVHEERIIVGELSKQTPVFSHKMETIVFHPYWGVPNSIKVNELLPSIARGGNALQRHNLKLRYRGRVVDPSSVDWSRADIRSFDVFQPPGGGNVLGQVKFRFPNRHQVYMHDTPTKNLFNKRQRTFSHGCMRVRNPLKLAEAVLNYDKGWDHDRVQSTVDNGPENNTVVLEKPVLVHVTYFTAVAQPDGTVKAFRDIYGHQERIELALAGRWNEIEKGRDHLAPVKLDRSRIVYKQQYSDPISDLFKQAFGF